MLLLVLQVVAADPQPYWQQAVGYTMSAALDEPSGVLTGSARITYTNHSPDTLADFYVHQYLNAFRPGSRWARADSAEGRVRFQALSDPDYAFERITRSAVMGLALAPGYPFAPDSTIAHWRLPRPLAPGDSMVVEIDWQARPSTLPRRQGRRGRRFDFAQWYPRVVVYDRLGWQAHPLYPAGEFYGEFGWFDVTLDLAADQVVGATGVPVEGDPGWLRARADQSRPVDYQHDWYPPAIRSPDPASPLPRAPGDVATWGCGGMEKREGRKCVRFYARDVHHFAFSLNPEYRYEEGRYGDVVVRVLYLPQDTATWGGGIAVRRTVAALAWLDSLFGAYPWPQLTNLHRIESGGTEFPMMIMDGSAAEGLIVHEVGHNYLMGILANNEWREGWLDEGFTSFQTGWYFEARGQPPGYAALERDVLSWDLEGWSEPVATPGEHFRDFATYGKMTYDKGRLFFEQLRYIVGDDVMRRILRAYYARWKLKHVDEGAFREAAEAVARMDLGWLFGEWLHATPLIDYRLKQVERRRTAGGWRTTVTIERRGAGRMPLEIGDRDTIYARATGLPAEERVSFTSRRRPRRLLLDPRARGHDWDMRNNAEPVGLWRRRGRDVVRLDWPLRDPQSPRDRGLAAVMPVAWSSDFGGLHLGIRTRWSYLGRLRRSTSFVTWAFGDGPGNFPDRLHAYARSTAALRPGTEATLAWWRVEGLAGAALGVDRSLRARRTQSADPHVGFDAMWMATTDLGYLDPLRWDHAGTVEFGPWAATTVHRDSATWRARAGLRGGIVYRYPGSGLASAARYDVEGFARATLEASVRRPGPAGLELGARAFAGGYVAEHAPSRQRRIHVAGADPYQTFANPLLRSRGALLVRPEFQYHGPGQGNLRGFRPDLGGRWVLSVNVEAARPLFARASGVARKLGVTAFADAGLVDAAALPTFPAGTGVATLYDAGVGLHAVLELGDLGWTTRFELPLLVSRSEFAADPAGRAGRLALRWQVSLEPSF